MISGNSRLSDKAQTRIDTLLTQADTLFSYGWLRQSMFDELKKSVNHKSGYSHFCSRLQEGKDLMFITEYFLSYRSTLQSIIDECENPYGDEDVVVGLAKERAALIEEYAMLPLSREWDRIRKTYIESWRPFARRRDYRSVSALSELRELLHIVDRISIITDILNRREGCYGLNLNYNNYNRYVRTGDNEHEQLTRLQLKILVTKAVDMCRTYFWANTSMAVLFAILKEDYAIEDNASEFERFMQEVLKGLEPTLDYGCPQNTIASAKQSGEYLKYPISQWQMYTNDTRVFRLLNELRIQMEKAMAELKEENTEI